MKKKQGGTTNKLIITRKDYSPQKWNVERESFRCTSEQGAEKILSKRDKRRIFFATFFDKKGVKKVFNFNTNDTILQA